MFERAVWAPDQDGPGDALAPMADNDTLYLELIALLEAGQVDTARQKMMSFRAAEPKSQRGAVLWAHLLEREGAESEAREFLASYLATHVDNAVARSNLARLQWKSGDTSKALSTLRFGLMQSPNQERALHLYAAICEQQNGWQAGKEALRTLGRIEGAWLPAWVGAQLCAARSDFADLAVFLVGAAQASSSPFPPSHQTLRRLLLGLPAAQRREVIGQIRPYTPDSVQAGLDQLLEAAGESLAASLVEPLAGAKAGTQPIVSTALRRSTWRHLVMSTCSCRVALAPIHLVNPDSWGVEMIAGRLARGLALLLSELLDASFDCPALVAIESLPESGIVNRDAPTTGPNLAAQVGCECDYLVTSYLSHRAPDEFILDAEVYDGRAVYLGRESCRGAHPGVCIEGLAERLSQRIGVEEPTSARPPRPELGIEDALARDAAASILLCALGSLANHALGNSGLLLDRLVQYAVQAQGEGSALLILWGGIEAAARAGLPGAEAQRTVMTDILAENEGLAYWVNGQETSR